MIAPAVINIAEKLGKFSDHWNPRIVSHYNGNEVRVSKLLGEFIWHSHADTDELFLVLKGELLLEMEQGNVLLREGELYVVPKGVRHNPVAESECHVMLVERKTTLHTGDIITDKTRSIADQLRPLDDLLPRDS